MIKKKDIFDKIMELPGLHVFNSFYVKNKEILLYLFFGGLAFLVSVGSYSFFYIQLELNELVANIFSWVLAVIFAYITNKIWVFQIQIEGRKALIKQVLNFFKGRLFTLLVEEVILFVFITKMQFNSIAVKVFAQIVVIVLNYFISKMMVFKTT